MSEKKKWFSAGISSMKIAAGNNTTASLVNTGELKARMPDVPESGKAFSFSGELPSFTMHFKSDASTARTIPVFIRGEDGSKTLTLVSEAYLKWMLLLGVWRVEW